MLTSPAILRLMKSCVILAVLGIAANSWCGAAKGQQADNKNVREEKLAAADGWPIHATYYESPAGKESPAIILLAGAEGVDKKDARNRRVWQTTALALQKDGFAVMAVDLRKHGDSIPAAIEGEPLPVRMAPNDYQLMASLDLEAVKEFLLEEHKSEKLNIRKTGIVSVGSSALVAAAFAVTDWAKKPYPDAPTLDAQTPRGQDIRCLIMYSPNSAVKGLNSNTIMRSLNGFPIAMHIIASRDIKDDFRSAERIYKTIEIKDEQYKDARKMTTAAGEITAEGFLEGRFADPTNKDISEFLTKSLKEADMPWASRKSRLE
ncbi:MAG: hypothetical protein O2856_09165 [Planctomycetota bacterium]|nr:hypothetical protein [Planctomycetota bacterium]